LATKNFSLDLYGAVVQMQPRSVTFFGHGNISGVYVGAFTRTVGI
jgi:hypothetical protein